MKNQKINKKSKKFVHIFSSDLPLVNRDFLSTSNSYIEPNIGPMHDLDDVSLVEIFLYGHKSLNPAQNKGILNATIEYILKTERFT